MSTLSRGLGRRGQTSIVAAALLCLCASADAKMSSIERMANDGRVGRDVAAFRAACARYAESVDTSLNVYVGTVQSVGDGGRPLGDFIEAKTLSTLTRDTLRRYCSDLLVVNTVQTKDEATHAVNVRVVISPLNRNPQDPIKHFQVKWSGRAHGTFAIDHRSGAMLASGLLGQQHLAAALAATLLWVSAPMPEDRAKALPFTPTRRKAWASVTTDERRCYLLRHRIQKHSGRSSVPLVLERAAFVRRDGGQTSADVDERRGLKDAFKTKLKAVCPNFIVNWVKQAEGEATAKAFRVQALAALHRFPRAHGRGPYRTRWSIEAPWGRGVAVGEAVPALFAATRARLPDDEIGAAVQRTCRRYAPESGNTLRIESGGQGVSVGMGVPSTNRFRTALHELCGDDVAILVQHEDADADVRVLRFLEKERVHFMPEDAPPGIARAEQRDVTWTVEIFGAAPIEYNAIVSSRVLRQAPTEAVAIQGILTSLDEASHE